MSLRKVINSATQQFEPVLVDKLVLDAVPTVNSFNSVTSDAVARAVAGASGEVPQVTESDNGKVLKAVYDEGGAAVEWGEAAPAVTVDQTYNALSANPQSGTAVAEAIAGIPAPSVDEVPDVTSSDDGKVLQATYSGGAGSYAWATPATVTVDQTYNASSANPQSGTAVAGAIANVKQVPASTSADSTKVLTVNASGNPEWQTAQGGGGSAIPSVTSADNNKVLKASYSSGSGTYNWGNTSLFTHSLNGGSATTWTIADVNNGSRITVNITNSSLYLHEGEGINFHPFMFRGGWDGGNLQEGQTYRLHIEAYSTNMTRGGGGPLLDSEDDVFFVKKSNHVPVGQDFNVKGSFINTNPLDIDFFIFEVYDLNGTLMKVGNSVSQITGWGSFEVGV